MKQAIQEQLGTDVDIERAHRVERRNRDHSSQDTQQRKPCTIVCKLRCWKQREAVLKKARKSRLSFMQVNIRSLQCNLDGLTNMLLHLDLKFSFIGISETWLKDISHTCDILPGYKFIHNHRIDADGGGVGLYLAENFELKNRPDLVFQNSQCAESLFAEVIRPKQKIIGVLYRLPNQNLQDFLSCAYFKREQSLLSYG